MYGYVANFRGDSTYYMCSNPDVGSTEQELINIFEHQIYAFYLHERIIPQCQSHYSIQFIAARSSEKQSKLSISISGSRSPKITLSICINQLVRCGVISAENVSLEDPVCSHFLL